MCFIALGVCLRWQGADISPAMLDVAREREVEGDLLLGDLGHGLPLRAGAFDGAISISAVQWLCNAVRFARCSAGLRCGAAKQQPPRRAWRTPLVCLEEFVVQ